LSNLFAELTYEELEALRPTDPDLVEEIIRRKRAKESLVGYARYVLDKQAAAHHILICETLEKVLRGEEKRVIISAPPGSAKSTYASVAFPAYALGYLPKESLIISASYADELATDFGRKVRNTLKSEEHGLIFPEGILSPSDRAADRFSTLKGTSYYTTGVGGPITGKRADILLLDDPVKGRADADSKAKRDFIWNWYSSDATTRLKKGGAIVIIGTRWHEDDLIGRVLQNAEKGGEKWLNICLPAICEESEGDPLGRKEGEALWPEWQPIETLISKRDKEGLSSRDWNSLYQQRPAPQEGNSVLRSWFKEYDHFWVKQNLHRMTVIQSWDTASTVGAKSDPSCCVTAAVDFETKNIYILDVFVRKMEYIELRAEASKLAATFKPNAVLVESAGSGIALGQELSSRGVPVIKISPARQGDKSFRFEKVTPLMEAGKFHVCSFKPWCGAYVDELVTFPAAKHDDQVDATSQLLNWYEERSIRFKRGQGRIRN